MVTAKDGLDALEKLAEGRPSVMLTDIEMPRMDGFDLVRNLRADPHLADLPVENGNGNGEVKVEIPLTETAPLA